MDIIDFKKQKFIRDCIEFLKSNKTTIELKEVINTATPSYIDYLKKGESEDTKKVIDATITKVKQLSQKEVTANRQKINITGNSVTNEAVIRSGLLLDEGDPFSKVKVDKSISNLKSKGIL